MLVFCCGMYRSGSTLQYQVASHIVESSRRGRRVPWTPADDLDALIDRLNAESSDQLFVIKSHLITDGVRREFAAGRATGIYIYRDLRDVFISQMHKQGMSFRKMLASGFIEECIALGEAWRSLRGVLVSRYEDVIGDLPTEVDRIAEHLGVPIDSDACRAIAAEYSIEKQRERTGSVGEQGFDDTSLLHGNHIRTGSSEQWRDELSPGQLGQIEKIAGAWLETHGYTLGGRRPSGLRRAMGWLLDGNSP